ncbi:ABC transporter permease [Agromyces seonyuensis]|uniref:ABC transporter permease subunit n=1 Tax=Agromyces seonyuensis TaxID=2662446 RepID=A0A6I4P588_9MICO|nr:ABC transporter permease [Agromyces seonyuensis]MWB98677.1 ABC transporter permease subunit [Agromyces seonyuensis]
MNLIADGFAWLTDPANWTGAGSIPERLVEHLLVSLLILLIAGLIALPVGFTIGHTGRGKGLAVAVTGGMRAIPTLGLLTLAALWLGIGLAAPILALVVLAIPPLLAGAYSGLESVDRRVLDAAKGVGMTGLQRFTGVELPLSAPIVIGGIRSAALQIIATATLAAYTSDFGLGRFLFRGLKTNDYAEAFGAAVLVIALALLVDGLFALAQRFSVPVGVRVARSGEPTRSAADRATGRTTTNV